jgi:DNA-binding GntR family transcriptional regulator
VERLATRSAVEALETELERRILDGDLRPGERLREVELATRYGVGRHTLRAAFDALVRRGLLSRTRNRGVSVPVLTRNELAEIYELRAALEVEAFRALAVRGEVPPEAREAIARLSRLGPRAPWRLVVAADFDFHSAIVEAAGNRRLKRVHDELQTEILLCLAQLGAGYATPSDLAEEHRELLAKIEARKRAAAEQAIRSHFERALSWLQAAGERTTRT